MEVAREDQKSEQKELQHLQVQLFLLIRLELQMIKLLPRGRSFSFPNA